MAYVWAFFRGWYFVLAGLCALFAPVELIKGNLAGAGLLLGCAVWGVLLGWLLHRKASAAKRHRTLRAARLERERRGVSPRRGR